MDPNRFDRFSRSLGQRLNRRQALGSLAVAGTALGTQTLRAHAQGGSCAVTLTASVRIGPGAGTQLVTTNPIPGELTGTLTLPPAGSTDAVFTVAPGIELPAIVEQQGHLLNVRLPWAPLGVIVFSGMASAPLDQCAGTVDGLFTGPNLGDIGDWHGTMSGAGAGSGTSTGGAASSTDSSNGAPTVAPTTVAVCGEVDAPCQADAECCDGFLCIQGRCYCGSLTAGCGNADDAVCCEPLTCALRPGSVFATCCIALGSAGCEDDAHCCEGYCFNGLCSESPPEPCGNPGEPCNNMGLCCGNAYCDMQDPPGTCICAAPGEQCIPVGNGACCSGDACDSNGLCP